MDSCLTNWWGFGIFSYSLYIIWNEWTFNWTFDFQWFNSIIEDWISTFLVAFKIINLYWFFQMETNWRFRYLQFFWVYIIFTRSLIHFNGVIQNDQKFSSLFVSDFTIMNTSFTNRTSFVIDLWSNDHKWSIPTSFWTIDAELFINFSLEFRIF